MDMRDYVGPSYIKYPDVVDAPRQERIVAIQEGSFDCKGPQICKRGLAFAQQDQCSDVGPGLWVGIQQLDRQNR